MAYDVYIIRGRRILRKPEHPEEGVINDGDAGQEGADRSIAPHWVNVYAIKINKDARASSCIYTRGEKRVSCCNESSPRDQMTQSTFCQ